MSAPGTRPGWLPATRIRSLLRSRRRVAAPVGRAESGADEQWGEELHRWNNPLASGHAGRVGVVAGVVLVLLTVLDGCTAREPAGANAPVALTARVIAQRPHDPTAFTEGLTFADGRLWESTGLVGDSSVRQIDPGTGAVQRRAAADGVFGEGIAVVGNAIWQLTWKDDVVLEWDRATLDLLKRIPLEGAREGWGLCADGPRLLSSDGSSVLTVRDPASFRVDGHIQVTDRGVALNGLNALDCGGDNADSTTAWANVWPTNRVVRIDLTTGAVTGELDLTALRRQAAAIDPGIDSTVDDVPNGIAVVRSSDADVTAWITGKRWPELYLVRITTNPTPGAI